MVPQKQTNLYSLRHCTNMSLDSSVSSCYIVTNWNFPSQKWFQIPFRTYAASCDAVTGIQASPLCSAIHSLTNTTIASTSKTEEDRNILLLICTACGLHNASVRFECELNLRDIFLHSVCSLFQLNGAPYSRWQYDCQLQYVTWGYMRSKAVITFTSSLLKSTKCTFSQS